MALPVVAIVGRPNVGKSTLFNRVIRRMNAVVDSTPGVTRDRNYAATEWNGLSFTLVDTGGYLPPGDGDELTDAVSEQTMIATDEADVILFVIDSQTGLVETDVQLSKIILRKGTPTLLIMNKVDDVSQLGNAWEAGTMGMGDPVPVSSKAGFLFADMLDTLVELLQKIKPVHPESDEKDTMSLAIIGSPNSGKSSLVNRLTGNQRMVVSNIPGTTRDAVDTVVKYHGLSIRLIDTAGLRRKRYGEQGLDFYMTLRALRALERCEVTVIMIDAEKGLVQGDMRLINQADEAGTGILLAVNKWDLVEKDQYTADQWLENWKFKMPTFQWVPVLFVSALTGQRSIKILERALEVKKLRDQRIATADLNEAIGSQLLNNPPPAVKGKLVRVKYIAQVTTRPPHFVCFASHSKVVPKSYYRYVERLIRKEYDFTGVPVKVSFRGK